LRARLARWGSRALGLSPADFPDIYQSAWRKLLDAERAGRPTRNQEYALRWAMHNSWLEECRRRRRRPAIGVEDIDMVFTDAGVVTAGPAEQLEQRETMRSVLAALEDVGDRAAIILLQRVCGFSPDEVCASVGVTRRTYRAEHARAMSALHRLRIEQ
jgi:RNA polymerase sigma factor (sigma-70 family)